MTPPCRLAGTIIASLFFLTGAAAEPPAVDSGRVEITLYAASSLREALQELAPLCEKIAGARLVVNFGASSDLARQIEAAEKADLFFSADEAQMNRLSKAGLLEEDSRISVLSNRLVVVVPADSSLTIHSGSDLASSPVRRLSLANPEAVPAGKYARAWLERSSVWEKVERRIVPGVDVRAALAAVESGAVEAGIVYRTDAAISKKVRVVFQVPREEAQGISYPLALLRGRPALERSRKVLSCLTGPAAKAVFEARGFIFLRSAP